MANGDLITPEYQKLIELLTKRGEEQRRQAEARAQTEVGRRGLITPTGTSDIEFAARQAATRPITETSEMNIAQLLGGATEAERGRRFTSEEAEKGRQFTGQMAGYIDPATGQWVSSAAREAQLGREWQTGERLGGQQFAGQMAGYINPQTGKFEMVQDPGAPGRKLWGGALEQYRGSGQGWNAPQKQKRKWWEGAVSPLAEGVGTGASYWGLSKLPWGK